MWGMKLIVCYSHVTYAFQGESAVCLNVKELLAWNRCNIWSLSITWWSWWSCQLSHLMINCHLMKQYSINFLYTDKHQYFLQVNFNTLDIEVSYKIILSLLMGVIKHYQNTQSNKFAISLQYHKFTISLQYLKEKHERWSWFFACR